MESNIKIFSINTKVKVGKTFTYIVMRILAVNPQ